MPSIKKLSPKSTPSLPTTSAPSTKPGLTNKPATSAEASLKKTSTAQARGDSYRQQGPAQASSSRPSINAHEMQGPQVQAPQLSESEVRDLALGRSQAKGKAKEVPMPRVDAPPRPFVKEACEQMKQEVPGSEILRYTDQGGHPTLKRPVVQEKFPVANQGVCSAMTSEWIRTGIEAGGDPDKGAHEFGKLKDDHFSAFVVKQHDEMLRGDKLKAKNQKHMENLEGFQDKVSELQQKQAQQKQLAEKMKDPNLSPDERKSLKQERAQLQQELRQGTAEAGEQAQRIEHKAQKLETRRNEFRAGRGGGYEGVRVQDYEPIDGGTFATKLHQGTMENGHYRLGLKKDGEGAEGHVIGLHKTDGACRLMDANTAEWKTQNHKDMVNLTAEHIDRLYPDYGSFDLTRYNS